MATLTKPPTHPPTQAPTHPGTHPPPEGGGKVPPLGATLTDEEVGLLSQYQVTYQNGRWVHTELTPTEPISKHVNTKAEQN